MKRSLMSAIGLISLLATGIAVGQNPPPLPAAASFFSLNINKLSDPWPTQLHANFGILRTLGADLIWSQLEPCEPADETNVSDPCYAWNTNSHFDRVISTATQNGQDILYTAYYTPTWASQNPSDVCANNLGYGGCWPPVDVSSGDLHWKHFLAALYKHVASLPQAGGRQPYIKYWECWNEPDIPSEYYAFTAPGLAQLNTLCQDLHNTIHSLDPNAKFTTPAPTSVQGVANWMSQWVGAGYANEADYIAFHGYLCSNINKCYNQPEDVVSKVITPLRAALAHTSAARLPLWDTEGGAHGSNLQPDMHAAFISRFMLVQQSANVSAVSYFGWDFDNINLIDNPGDGATLNPAGVAWQQLYNWTVAQGIRTTFPCINTSGTVWQCKSVINGKNNLMVWDTSQTTLPCANGACGTTIFPVPSGYSEFDDLTGNVNQRISGNSVLIGMKPIRLH